MLDEWQVADLDVGAYLTRVGLEAREPSIVALGELHEAHVRTFTFNNIDVLLGHPLVDPHGDPIPRRDGTVDHPADAVALDSAPPGRYRILRISDRDPDLLRRAQDVGLTPGRALELDGRHRHDLARALIDLSGIVVAPVLREDADGQPTRG